MLKAGKWGIVLALALTLGFGLLVPGAFTQSVKTDQHPQTRSAVMTAVPQMVTPFQQATEKLSFTRRGPGFRGHFFFHRRHFFHRHRFFHGFGGFNDCDVDCDCDFW